jgi:hypothetical protein
LGTNFLLRDSPAPTVKGQLLSGSVVVVVIDEEEPGTVVTQSRLSLKDPIPAPLVQQDEVQSFGKLFAATNFIF